MLSDGRCVSWSPIIWLLQLQFVRASLGRVGLLEFLSSLPSDALRQPWHTHTHFQPYTHTALTSVFRREGVRKLSCLVSPKLFLLQVSSRLEGFLRRTRPCLWSFEADFSKSLDLYTRIPWGIQHFPKEFACLQAIPEVHASLKEWKHLLWSAWHWIVVMDLHTG